MERIPPRAYEVQAGTLLGLQTLQDWVDWAEEAIVAGYDSQSLRILAGLQAPYDDHEIERLAKWVFTELDIAPLKKEDCLPYYFTPVLYLALDRKITQKEALVKLKKFYFDKDLDKNGQKVAKDFYLLYHAFIDLEISNEQWYWKGANRENITEIIDDYFEDWLKKHGQNLPV